MNSNSIKKNINRIINKETALYTIFGVITSLLNVFLFALLVGFNINYNFANVVTLIIVKLTAYICNKNFVFNSHCSSIKELMYEVLRFIVARGVTMIIEILGLIFLVELVSIPKVIGKIIMTVTIIILNYIFGKKIVFKGAD